MRTANEDVFVVRPPLFAVADGVGGHRAGIVASATVARTIADAATHHFPANAEDVRRLLVQANAAVRAAAAADAELRGMGSTCTVALVNTQLVVGHVGDTRAYRLRHGTLRQLTVDHTLVGQLVEAGQMSAAAAISEPNRHVLLRALGASDDVEIDVGQHELRAGDRLLLCSDGLSDMLVDETIEGLLRAAADPQQAADALVDAANMSGGRDNATAVVVEVASTG